MGIENLFGMLGGLALFLYGMQMMGNGLETAAGNKMKRILEKLTSNRLKAVVVGAVITAVIQSSSATTVMVVGFVNSGLMTLNQAVWIIMGANVGTTITSQLIALDIGAIAPMFAFAGVAVIMFSKKEKVKHISEIFAGLGILFIGMDMMSGSMQPLQNSPAFIGFMTNFSNPFMGILLGAAFTAVVQSSSASVGILQALTLTGVVPLSSAVYILFGQNIGTCITAVLASIGTKVGAKRATAIHLMFNIFGSLLFTLLCMVTPFVSWVEALSPGKPVVQVANVHTIFNIVTTLLLLPFGSCMAKLSTILLPDNKKEEEQVQRLAFIKPFESNYTVGHAALVLSQLGQEVNRMLDIVTKNISEAFDLVLKKKNSSGIQEVEEREEYIDYLNTAISTYIVSLMSTEMTGQDSKKINEYYMIISNLERIGDHAMNIAEYAVSLEKRSQVFSSEALEEVRQMKETSLELLSQLKEDAETPVVMLRETAKYEQQIDDMKDKFMENQIQRMQTKTCHPETGLLYSELLTDFERVGDHALNIAELYCGKV